MDLAAEVLVFERMADATLPNDGAAETLPMDELFPPHDFGAWPDGFVASREQIYGDDGR